MIGEPPALLRRRPLPSKLEPYRAEILSAVTALGGLVTTAEIASHLGWSYWRATRWIRRFREDGTLLVADCLADRTRIYARADGSSKATRSSPQA